MKKNIRYLLWGTWSLMCLLLCGSATVLAQVANIKVLTAEADVTKLCGFNNRTLELYVENASDSCTWQCDAGIWSSAVKRGKRGGKTYNDTIMIFFGTAPISGKVYVSVGTTGVIEGQISLVQIPQAKNVPFIDVSYPFCENVNTRFLIPKDHTDYTPGSLLYEWFLFESGASAPLYRETKSGEDTSFTFALPKMVKNGKARVTPHTCDNGSSSKDIDLSPFVIIKLFDVPADVHIKPIGYNTTNPSDVKWEDQGGPVANKVCGFYNNSFNTPGNAMGSNYGNYYGAGDGYVYLQAGEFKKYENPEDAQKDPEYYYRYNWDFEPTQFELATDRMNETALKKHGFGPNKNRIALKVLGAELPDKNYIVGVSIICDTCIQKGGDAGDFTLTLPSISFTRRDSIKSYKTYEVVSALPEICAGMENTFNIKLDDIPVYEDSRAIGFVWKIPTGWEKVGGGLDGLEQTFKIARVTQSARPGDTAEVTVYPYNECFANLKSKQENGKTVKLYVKNPPLRPYLMDPLTGEEIEPQYTDFRAKQLMINPHDTFPVLLCNYTEWIGGQKFDLKVPGDTVWGFSYVDFSAITDVKDVVNIGKKTGTKNEGEFLLWLHSDSRARLAGYQLKKFGFYAKNRCGDGDTGVFHINVIDTLAVYGPITTTMNITDEMTDTNLCEGWELQLTSNSAAYKAPNVDRLHKVTDVVTYEWKLPTGWVKQTGTGSTAEAPILYVGEGSGSVQLRYTNKCGSGVYKKTHKITVHPFVRVNIQPHERPCEGDLFTFTFDTVVEAEGYRWTFPSGWLSPDGTQSYECTNAQALSDGKIHVPVTVGSDSGYIYVVGKKHTSAGCNYTFDNYESKPHRRDSLLVKPKNYTSAPQKKGVWLDTLCARDVISLSVKPNSRDSNVYFTWIFPDPSWHADTVFSKIRDTASFRVPTMSHQVRTIQIVSHRYDCESTNIGDTLHYSFLIMDTLKPVGPFYDAAYPDARLNHKPCQGDTVYYMLKSEVQDPSVYYTQMVWNGGHLFKNGDSIDETGWRVLSKPPYKDTLKLVVGRSTLTIGAATVSLCDTSSYFMDSIIPYSLVVKKGAFVAYKNQLCNQEELVFSHNPVEHATDYIWHYPWGKRVDTVKNTGADIYEYVFKSGYDTGYVYIQPYNSCGKGPVFDSVRITDVLYPPQKVQLMGFSGFYDPLVSDTAVDTVCLRNAIDLKAYYSEAAHPSYTWQYQWKLSVADASVALTPKPNCSDSLCVFEKQSGGEKTNWVMVAARHKSCVTLGKPVYVEMRSMDTAAIASDKNIRDYLYDLKTEGQKIETGPCGADSVGYYFKASQVDATLSVYKFIWNGAQNYNPADSTMDGTQFKLLEIAADPNRWDTLKMQVGNAQKIKIQVVGQNSCGTSTFPEVEISTKVAITPLDIYRLRQISSHLCDKEDLVFQIDTVAKASAYQWHFPWPPYVDTVYTATRGFKTAYQPGRIFVIPFNGCGLGHPSDTIQIEAKDILVPPSKVKPLNFALSYNPTADQWAQDTLCLRTPSNLSVYAPEGVSAALAYEWKLIEGRSLGFGVVAGADSICSVEQKTFQDTAFILQASARIKACKRYGDTLQVRLFPMDTLAFVSTAITDSFSVETGKQVFDLLAADPTAPIGLSPCGKTEVQYKIKTHMHWSLDTTSWFSWGAGEVRPRPDSSLGETDWRCLDPLLLPGLLYGQVSNTQKLSLRIHARNHCGFSVSPALEIKPTSRVLDIPVFNPINRAICYGEKISLSVGDVPFADEVKAYVWKADWKVGLDTTTLPSMAYLGYEAEGGKVQVWARNSCGNGPISAVFTVPTTAQIPSQPKPLWYNSLRVQNDTVYDTICYHGGVFTLKAKSRVADTLSQGISYQWAVAAGVAVDIIPDADPWDTLCSVAPSAISVAGDNALLMVAAKRRSCNLWGDTLYIALHIRDTVTVASLGLLKPVVPDTFNLEPCPGAEMAFEVEHLNAAPAYKWTLPPTWSFATGSDSLLGKITVVVGSLTGYIKVAPLTDREQRQCRYYAVENALSSAQFRPHLPLVTKDTMETYVQQPCVGSEEEYEVKKTWGAVGYRWEFPRGWKVISSGGAMELESDSVVSNGGSACKVRVGSTPGKVRIYALDSCGGTYLVRGSVFEKDLLPVDTAHITVLGDLNVCIDSLTTLQIGRDVWVDGYYHLSVLYTGPDLTPNEIRFPLSPDSSQIDMVCKNRDSVILTFTPANKRCPSLVKPTVHVIVADSIPAISGSINGPVWACARSIHNFKAHADMDIGNNVAYRWEVPQGGGWAILAGEDSSQVRVRVGNYAMSGSKDTVKCYPRALCGTAQPFIWVLQIDPSIVFTDEILADNIRPCTGTEVQFSLKNSYNYEVDSTTFKWESSSTWLHDSDTTPRATFTVSIADTMEVWVSSLKPNTCGWSDPISLRVNVKDSAFKASLTQLPFPCKDNESVLFAVQKEPMIDSVFWVFPPIFTPNVKTYTREGYGIKADSAVLEHTSIENPFILTVRSFNNCGFRDTSFTITPVNRIPNFETDLTSRHYCPGDTAFVYIPIPNEHLGKGTLYHWHLLGSDTLLSAFVDPLTHTAVASFKATQGPDSTRVAVYGYNSCNATDTVYLKTAPHRYWIRSAPSKDTVMYMDQGVGLQVKEVQYKLLGDYTYEWFPSNRVSVTGVSSDAYLTLNLVQPQEEFYVKAVEKVNNPVGEPLYKSSSACVAYDTVHIWVNGTFAMKPKTTDTTCIEKEVNILAMPQGGNEQKRYFDWYRMDQKGLYQALDLHNEEATFTADESNIRLMVVGWDSTYLYPPMVPGAEPIYRFSKVDTQYILLHSFKVDVKWVQPGKEDLKVPYGTKLSLSVKAEGGSNAYTYLWEPVDLFEPYKETSSSVRTLRLYKDYDPSLTVTDMKTGCTKQVQMKIAMNDLIGEIPNAFSPNTPDGINDLFMKGADVIIYNRLGVELFRSKEQEGWDGTYKGHVVAKGEYLYVVSIIKDGQTYTKKGVVTVF